MNGDAGYRSEGNSRRTVPVVDLLMHWFLSEPTKCALMANFKLSGSDTEALQVMDTGCRLFLVAGPLFLQFLGASFTQGTVSSIPIVGSISPEGFLPPILLLVVIIVTVVIVAVILVVVVVAIVGVVIVVAIIGVVVVVGGVSFIIKLSFVIIGSLLRIVFCYLIY
ncbi:hypothetical protein Tco_0424366 [Tanacetum coccineum]